nr:C-type lectin domain family 4 member E-like isoform X2 [Procambarus clarkii]
MRSPPHNVTMFAAVVLVISLLTQMDAGEGADACPAPFFMIGEGCYYYSETFMTWQEARATCKNLLPEEDADLVVMDTYCDDFLKIESYAISNGLKPFWVGAAKVNLQDYWAWVDGRPVDLTSHYWKAGYPTIANDENCVFMAYGLEFVTRMRLYTNDCHYAFPFMCQLGVQALK